MQSLKNWLLRGFCVLWLGLLCATWTRSETVDTDWNGFRVDMSRTNIEQRQALTPSILAQLKIIISVDLPPAMLAYFRTVPIVVDANYSAHSRALFHGSDGDGHGEIKTGLMPLDPAKPVLLHEMMHAYDGKYWHNANPQVTAAYQQAVAQSLYPAQSHFMHNAGEFFAISSTVYLYGHIAQPPYDCRKLAEHQGQYVLFFEKLFGHHKLCD